MVQHNFMHQRSLAVRSTFSAVGCTRLHHLVYYKWYMEILFNLTIDRPLGITLVESRGHECRLPASPKAKTRSSDRNQRVSGHRCNPISNSLLLELVLGSECLFIDQ
ncbi:hypothetical protein SO802_019394 [Lithocarpus litseifolius]|uniref:Uncharacterized protein n=1 Tax=Lithocarpus litseifolius TaxID=425828 RepID=A0AAW2CQK0_9ROSI